MPAEGRDRRVLERPVRISLAAVVVLINVVSAVVVLVLAGWVVAIATVCATTAAFATWRTREGLPSPTAETGLDPDRRPA